jgi:hypothetical protein
MSAATAPPGAPAIDVAALAAQMQLLTQSMDRYAQEYKSLTVALNQVTGILAPGLEEGVLFFVLMDWFSCVVVALLCSASHCVRASDRARDFG